MNQVIRKIFAGVSAAILSVSAISSDTWIGNFMQTLHADSDETVLKQGSQDNFLNPEQDTRTDDSGNKIYNTNYGLHTDKTVSKAYSDGRTFDIDLESWYIGEKPVDVGLVLDASGSMAWTTNTLYPLEIDTEDIESIIGKYGITDSNEDGSTDINDIVEWQNNSENGGYLPQDAVDLILDPNNTDNTKLGYDKYKYYVYEDRSSVSEFVPLGYWDGGADPIDDESLIGYYPFENSLENKAPKAADNTGGKYIEQDSTGFDTEKPASSSPAKFSDGGLDLYNTDKNGNVVIDISSLKEKNFSLSFSVKFGEHGKNQYNTPLVYVGNAGGNKFYSLFRGNVDSTGKGNSNNFRVVANNGDTSPKKSGAIKSGDEANWLDCSLTFEWNGDGYKGSCTANGKSPDNSSDGTIMFNDFKFAVDDSLYLILGGNELLAYQEGSTDISKNKIKDLKITVNSEEVANFPLSGNLKNTVTGSEIGNASLMKDGTDDGFNVTEEVESTSIELQYDNEDENYYLNLNKFAENGAVMLGALPDINSEDEFTISMKLKRTAGLKTNKQNIFYLGDKEQNNYYQFFRSISAGGYLGISKSEQEDLLNKPPTESDKVYYQGGLASNDAWYINTLVFKTDPSNDKKFIITPYINGKAEYQDGSNHNFSIDKIDVADFVFLLGALYSNDTGEGHSEHYVDDVYIFNSALSADKVGLYFGKELCEATEYDKTDKTKIETAVYHAETIIDGEKVDIAQISDSLANNLKISERRGWYYVNSLSDWKDIEGCLKSGKQYIGIVKDTGTEYYGTESKITIPSAYSSGEVSELLGNTIQDFTNYKNNLPESERSIRFFVDESNHLRCFVYSGKESSNDEPKRTFCSVVYTNDGSNGHAPSKLKYQTLNDALNTFFTELHKKSSFSKVSAVRFSTHNLLKGESDSSKLSELVMQNWTSDITGNMDNMDIINPRYPTPETANSAGSFNGQYNYVMTGGTYTWTGLKAFYDSVQNDKKNAAIKANGRPKYLIIFTDGRDNTQDQDSGSKNYDSGDYVSNKPNSGDTSITKEGQLAEAWAKKLKDEDYTIYCVMLATGSISPTANEDEYNRAANFLATLAGNKETKPEDKDKYVFISDPLDSEVTLENEFREVLNNMSSSLTGYTVQDYIDPRFDLVDKEKGLLKLGANGEITNSTGIILKDSSTEYLEYTPKDLSYGGGENDKAKIYYDSVKDMYYLRWKVDSIGGGNAPFTTDETEQYLNESLADNPETPENEEQDGMWHCTITVKAKDDFIGGNAILTNGNEAGMNLVFNENSIPEDDKSNPSASEQLQTLSGTDNSVDKTVTEEGEILKDTSPSKGFPRVCVNVRLLPIQTKPLNEVIYLGEVVSPTIMLNEIESDYMSGSYYLEYLERYAYRLYGSDADKMPLIQLLNEWLKISVDTEENKTFTIPYIYLPAPVYENNEIKENSIKNNTGRSLTDGNIDFTDPNLRDIVGFITYTWKRLDSNDPTKEYVFEGDNDIMDEFVVKSTDRICYSLELKFTPLPQSDTLEDFTLDKNFITDGEKFFTVTDGEFSDSSVDKWTFGTRAEYLKALISDKSHGAEEDDVYEWSSGYKPTKGTPQVEEGQNYGDATIDGHSLIASTTYTKDVVNAGLALEMIVKGEDLKSGEIKITSGKTFEFTAKRNYTDELDPLPYKDYPDSDMKANASEEEYKLTFTIDNFPDVIDTTSTYTIWAELTTITKGGTELKNGLPIGTYTIKYESEIEVKPASSTSGSSESSAVVFNNFNADNNRGNFIHTYFPENVCNESSNAATDTGDEKYLIWNGENLDFAKENIAENTKDADTKSLTFYFGTVPTKQVNGKDVANAKGYNKTTDPDNDYVKDRLGIIMLSYGSNRLAISKEVTSKNIAVIKEQAVLDNFWKFDITLKFNEEPKDTTEYSLKWLDLEGNELTGTEYAKSLKFEKDSATYTDGLIHYTAQISVKSNTQVILEQLPNDVSYEVSEIRKNQEKNGDFQDRYRYDILVEGEKPEIADDQSKGTSSGKLSPASSVNFINQFPSPELPSAGGAGIDITLYCGIMLVVAAGLYFTTLFCKKCRTHDEREE